MKKLILNVFIVIVAMSTTSCAVSAQSSRYHNRPSSPRPRAVLENIVVTGSLLMQTAEIIETRVAVAKARNPVQHDGYDVTVYGGPGNGYARKVLWYDAAIYSNRGGAIFVKFDRNGNETYRRQLGGSTVEEFVVTGPSGQTKIMITSIGTSSITLRYADGTNKLLWGR